MTNRPEGALAGIAAAAAFVAGNVGVVDKPNRVIRTPGARSAGPERGRSIRTIPSPGATPSLNEQSRLQPEGATRGSVPPVAPPRAEITRDATRVATSPLGGVPSQGAEEARQERAVVNTDVVDLREGVPVVPYSVIQRRKPAPRIITASAGDGTDPTDEGAPGGSDLPTEPGGSGPEADAAGGPGGFNRCKDLTNTA